jgi:hypothetical protein
MSLPDDNLLSFKILVLIDIKCLLGSDVNEVFSLIPEDLPPIRVGAGDLHVSRTSRTYNVP